MEAVANSTVAESNNTEQEHTQTAASDIPGVSVVHVTIPNSAVQSVIQANQPSVIQSAAGSIQVTPEDSIINDDEESRKRREMLARRPSYRKILNDLSAETPVSLTVTKVEEDCNSSDSPLESENEASNLSTSQQQHTVHYQQVIPAQTIQIATGDGTQGLQTLTMTNVASTQPAPAAATPTILQYAQGPDGQFLIPETMAAPGFPGAGLGGLYGDPGVPSHQDLPLGVGGRVRRKGRPIRSVPVQLQELPEVSTLSSPSGTVQYQIATGPNSVPQGVVMATANSNIGSPGNVTEEASRKRELRLLKNRDAARECRRKKKEYVKCLENRVAVLENQNKTLIDELKSLKELYCQKEAHS